MNDFERQLQRAAKSAMKDVAKDGQRQMDRVHRQYAGKPVTQVEPALRRALSGCAIKPDPAQLREWATLISQGAQIKFKA